MNIGATLRIQKETDKRDIEGFSGMKVQPFFRSKSFYELNHAKLSSLIQQARIEILALHYPSVQDNFVENLKMLRDTYQQRLFTVHPAKESFEEYIGYLHKIENAIIKLDVELSFENKPFRNGWHNNLNNIYRLAKEFPFASITYDTTHLPKGVETIEGIADKIDSVKIIHLSNVTYGLRTKDHLPVLEGQRDLKKFVRFLSKAEFPGPIILEYKNHDPVFLRREVKRVTAIAEDFDQVEV